jgi:hypothetical protein
MINRIFFIGEMDILRDNVPEDENVFFSIRADPFLKDELEDAYLFLSNRETGRQLSAMALTLQIRNPITEESIRRVTSFLFVPCYLRILNKRVIILSGDSPELLKDAAAAISSYLNSQGMPEAIINSIILAGESVQSNGKWLFQSREDLIGYYSKLLQTSPDCRHDLFFQVTSRDALLSTLSSLQLAEADFKQKFPWVYSLSQSKNLLENEVYALRERMASLEKELEHQKQFVDLLRSDHQTKELQHYYTHEYEILPLWYKRFGHLLKVISGKRTFRSLFRDDTIKYKD